MNNSKFLRHLFELGKIRTRKNSKFGQFSRSVVAAQKLLLKNFSLTNMKNLQLNANLPIFTNDKGK